MKKFIAPLGVGVVAAMFATSAYAGSASAWRDYEGRADVVSATRSAPQVVRTVEGPLVNGSVVPAHVELTAIPNVPSYGYLYEDARPVIVDRRTRKVAKIVEPYELAAANQAINRTTTAVVLGNGTVVTSERESYGNVTPPNTYGIDGLVPRLPSVDNAYYPNRERYGRRHYDRGYGRYGGPVVITPAGSAIIQVD